MSFWTYIVFALIITCLFTGIIYLRLYPECSKCKKCETCEICETCKTCPIVKIPTGAENNIFAQSFDANSVKIIWPKHTYFPYGYKATINSKPCINSNLIQANPEISTGRPS